MARTSARTSAGRRSRSPVRTRSRCPRKAESRPECRRFRSARGATSARQGNSMRGCQARGRRGDHPGRGASERRSMSAGRVDARSTPPCAVQEEWWSRRRGACAPDDSPGFEGKLGQTAAAPSSSGRGRRLAPIAENAARWRRGGWQDRGSEVRALASTPIPREYGTCSVRRHRPGQGRAPRAAGAASSRASCSPLGDDRRRPKTIRPAPVWRHCRHGRHGRHGVMSNPASRLTARLA